MASIKLGDLLVKAKVISETQLKSALAEQQKWGGRLGEILVRMNIVSEDLLVKALSKQLAMPAVDLDAISSVPEHVRSKIPPDLARDLVVLPLQLRDEGKTLVVAMAEPQNIKHLDTIRSVSRCRIVPQIAGRQTIAKAYTRVYSHAGEMSADDGEGFKVMDAGGHTMIKNSVEVRRPDRPAAPPPPQPMNLPAFPTTSSERVPAAGARTPADQIRAIEEAQRKEVAALKAMVEMLIERGVFSREEYLARVKR